MKFVKENVNPKNRKTGDCVIRAIAKAEGKDWLEIFDSLTAIARAKYTVPNDKMAYEKYLEGYETVRVFHEVEGKKKRFTVAEICSFEGTYIVSVASHLTTVADGVLYDTWDCSRKSAYKIWKVK